MKQFSSALVCILSLSLLFLCGISMLIGGRTADCDTLEDSKKEVLGYYHYLEVVGGFRRMTHQTRVGNTILLKNGYLTSLVPRTDTATAIWMANSVIRFAQATEADGIPFLYVQIPQKVSPATDLMPPGEHTYINENMDDHLRSLSDAGVDTLDLRQTLQQTGENPYDFFFRTDHHWTMEGGLWAAKTLSDYLNATYGTELDTQVLAKETFDVNTLPRWYLGSHGRTVTRGYISPDAFSILLPHSDTHFRVEYPDKGQVLEGSFADTMFDTEMLYTKDYYGQSTYEAILCGNRPLIRIFNLDNPDGLNILLLRDSYSSAMAPYLAMLCGEIDLLDVREENGNYTGDLNAYREAMQPDLVLAAYCSPVHVDRSEG